MPWVVLHVNCEKRDYEPVEQALLDCGADAVTLADAADQPLFEPGAGETPLWQSIRLSGLFDANIKVEDVVTQLQANSDTLHFASCQIEILEDKDWVRSWMDDYQPMRMGQHLWVCPSWKTPPAKEAVNLVLDPGMAFGTGTHATTSMCLRWLDAQYTTASIGQRIIDYGCGSGILAIAALLLGAKEACGVDIDPQALLTARDNAARNHLPEERLRLLLPPQTTDLAPADTVLANILAGPLLEMAPALNRLVKPGGQLVLSGILHTQVAPIINAYPAIEFDTPQVIDEWAMLSGTRHHQ
jgi:ribosomal protein L11 methyltransferase